MGGYTRGYAPKIRARSEPERANDSHRSGPGSESVESLFVNKRDGPVSQLPLWISEQRMKRLLGPNHSVLDTRFRHGFQQRFEYGKFDEFRISNKINQLPVHLPNLPT